jgi:ethanolamine utilization protein EutA
VGELAYRHARGEPLPATTAYGDLGIDLARRIAASPSLARDLVSHAPAGLGRATIQGLALHSTEVSGTTIYLPRPEMLPLADLPILGGCGLESSASDLAALVDLAASAPAGACLRVEVDPVSAENVKALAQRLRDSFARAPRPLLRPLVLITTGNYGKTLGHYATDWGRSGVELVVIDEMPTRRAHFASLGAPCQNVVPVTFHGLDSSPHGDAPPAT